MKYIDGERSIIRSGLTIGLASLLWTGCMQVPDSTTTKRSNIEGTANEELIIKVGKPDANSDEELSENIISSGVMTNNAMNEINKSFQSRNLKATLAAAHACALQELSLDSVKFCLEDVGKQVPKELLYNWNSANGEVEVDAVLLDEASGITVLGLMNMGLPANTTFAGYLSKDQCVSDADLMESIQYEPFQAIKMDSTPVKSELRFDFRTDADGNAMVFSVADFSLQQPEKASIVFTQLMPAKGSNLENAVTICIDYDSLNEISINQAEKAEKAEKVEKVESRIAEPPKPQSIAPNKVVEEPASLSLVEIFSRDVAPVLGKDCSSCHMYESETKWVLTNDTEMDLKIVLDPSRFNKENPRDSLFLEKALGREEHGGGAILASDSEAYRKLLEFLTTASQLATM